MVKEVSFAVFRSWIRKITKKVTATTPAKVKTKNKNWFKVSAIFI